MSRVLVIDDHPIVLQGVRQLLEDAGVNQITQALTLAEGFRLYRTHKDFPSSEGFVCTISRRRSSCSPCILIR